MLCLLSVNMPLPSLSLTHSGLAQLSEILMFYFQTVELAVELAEELAEEDHLL